MSEEIDLGGIKVPAADWEATPESVKLVLIALLQRIEALEEKLNKNSRNSSIPPSKDGFGAKSQKKDKQKRKPLIWDSTLIAEYLDETYPQPSFYPSAPHTRLECRKWEQLADTLGDSIIGLWVLDFMGDLAPGYSRKRHETLINRLLPIFDGQLRQGKYLLGSETWTAADVAALCSLGYYSFRLNEDWLLQYPYLKDWFNKLHERESVKSTIPKKIST